MEKPQEEFEPLPTYLPTQEKCPKRGCGGWLVYHYEGEEYLCFHCQSKHSRDSIEIVHETKLSESKRYSWKYIIPHVLAENPELRKFDSILDACEGWFIKNRLGENFYWRGYLRRALKKYMKKHSVGIKK